VIYTTNAIESVNTRVRKIQKTRRHFPSDDAAAKLIRLALRNITADWAMPVRHWKDAMNQCDLVRGPVRTRRIGPAPPLPRAWQVGAKEQAL
jgi:putative transposase